MAKKPARKNTPLQIALIGCGRMGGALLESWIDSGINARYTAVDPHPLAANLKKSRSVQHKKSMAAASSFLSEADIVILAVKPQIMAAVCADLNAVISSKALIVSIAAGQSLETLEGYFSPRQPIVRAMPNTPASVGKAITIMTANTYVTGPAKTRTARLMRSAGSAEWIENEAYFDAVTAVSGSGPAYVFYLIEIMTEAAKKQGLPDDLSEKLARQTVIGSAALAEANPRLSAAVLRKNVTSPGGTTEAALEILMDGKAQTIFNRAIAAAEKRGKQLNS